MRNSYRWRRSEAVPAPWGVAVASGAAYPLTQLARAEIAVKNGAQLILVPVYPDETGLFMARFFFANQTAGTCFLGRLREVAGLVGEPICGQEKG